MIFSDKFKDDQDALGIVLDFVDGLEVRMTELSKALEMEDFTKLEDAAHRLSGSAGLFGYPGISEFASQLENSAKRGELVEAQSIFEQVKSAYAAIRKGAAAIKASKNDASTKVEKSGMEPGAA